MILIAPTAFKGTLTARQAAAAMARGLADSGHPLVIQPLSDGGNGLIDALPGVVRTLHVTGPLGAPVEARLLLASEDEVVIESADACGLHLVPRDQRDPLETTTRGVGELLARAATLAPNVIVGLGGSATVDGGLGLGGALGWRFLDRAGTALPAVPASLPRVDRLVAPAAPISARVTALADVTTPLAGPQGAARVFGPQKGADAEMVEWLDQGLAGFGALLRRELGVDPDRPGAGAAGGLGAALAGFCGARLERGSEWVMRRLQIDALLQRADLVITGEGQYDAQSALGKITGALIERAGAIGKPVCLIAGAVRVGVPAHVRVAQHARKSLDADALAALAQQAISG